MLDAAQEQVGLGEFGLDLGLDPAARRRAARARRAYRGTRRSGLAAAGDQLLRLHEELDLADAAAAELDVVAGDADVAEAA